jgi:urease accessory protein
MLEAYALNHAEPHTEISGYLTLPFELRQKSRLRASLDNGTEIGLFLPRGTVLRHGDYLRASTGELIEVRAAAESVSTATGDDALLLLRAAYHLGNRHVPLQIDTHQLRYRHDHVLDAMLRQLGLLVSSEQAPFEPEVGAYGGGHHHSHAHD